MLDCATSYNLNYILNAKTITSPLVMVFILSTIENSIYEDLVAVHRVNCSSALSAPSASFSSSSARFRISDFLGIFEGFGIYSNIEQPCGTGHQAATARRMRHSVAFSMTIPAYSKSKLPFQLLAEV